jgi:hypothetical protein
VAALGCHDKVREQAERDARDHERLVAIVGADEALDRALKSADDASRDGDDAKAAALLEGDVAHAAEGAIAAAARETLETPWGQARQAAVLAVMRERQASIKGYAEATRGDDLEAKLAAVQSQVALQERALEAAAAALAPPGPLGADAG